MADDKNVLELPKATYPVCNRAISRDPQSGAMIVWALGEPHPIVEKMKVVRLYIIAGASVEVYAAAEDGKLGARVTLPWHTVSMVEEVMDPATFVDEIASAEEESKGDEPETPAPAPGAATNGQPAASA